MLRKILKAFGRVDARAEQHDADVIRLYMVTRLREKALAMKGRLSRKDDGISYTARLLTPLNPPSHIRI